MIVWERSFLVLLTFCSVYPVNIKISASFKYLDWLQSRLTEGTHRPICCHPARHPQASLGPYTLAWVKASPCPPSFLGCQVGRCHYDEQINGGEMGKRLRTVHGLWEEIELKKKRLWGKANVGGLFATWGLGDIWAQVAAKGPCLGPWCYYSWVLCWHP